MELGKVEGFWSTLQLPQQALAKYFNIELQAHWLLIRKETNQLHHVNNDIIMSEWVRTYQPAPSRVSWQKCIFNMLFCVCAWACARVCVLTYITQAYLCELNVSLFMCVGVYTHVNGERKLSLMTVCCVWDLVIFLCGSGATTAEFSRCSYDKNLLNHESSSRSSSWVCSSSTPPDVPSTPPHNTAHVLQLVCFFSGKWMMYNTHKLHSHCDLDWHPYLSLRLACSDWNLSVWMAANPILLIT